MTYDEILQASQSDALRRKIRVALVVAAEMIRTEPESAPLHTERVAWAKQAFTDPEAHLDRMVWAVLAQNRNATFADVIGASDTIVQGAVNSAVNAFL